VYFGDHCSARFLRNCELMNTTNVHRQLPMVVVLAGSLRARLGLDRPRNAVHCTDLAEDGRLECQHMFGVLAKAFA
jgi:hypothetical protein